MVNIKKEQNTEEKILAAAKKDLFKRGHGRSEDAGHSR